MKISGRKLIVGIAALLMMLALCAGALAAALSYPFTTVTSDKVNLRAKASSTATILERVPAGATVKVLGTSGTWFKVTYKNRTGYIMQKYVVTDASAIVTAAPDESEVVYGYPYETVTTAKCNLLQKNDKTSKVLMVVQKGMTVSVSKETNSYVKVTVAGVTGYINKSYVELKKVAKATAVVTAVPTQVPAQDDASYVTLQEGDSGSEVKALQEALIELGFLSGTADGKFGSTTKKAVMTFQAMNGYSETGVIDAIQQAHLYSGKPKNAKGTKQEVKTLAPVDGVTIVLNDKGDLVGTVQERLTALGYYTGSISRVYDSATQKAVKAFQKANGLTANGTCDAKTQNVLLNGGVAKGATATPRPTATPTPAPTYTIPSATVRKGSKGESALLVQLRLQELGYYTKTPDGSFGSTSVSALKAFQSANGLKADGVAGQGTYAVLFSANALPAGATPTPAPTAYVTAAPTATWNPSSLTKNNCVTVRLGVTGAVVSSLQTRLTELGYYNATVDGECKADDVAAIKAFQKMNGLTVDGAAGYSTQVKLYSSDALNANGKTPGSSGADTAYTTLRKGMSGDAVKQLQQKLISLGYLSGTADGNYGSNTVEAVKAFQKANGLDRDGVAGAETQIRLYSTSASAAATATPAPTSLHQGDKNDAVKTMQEQLIKLGYLTGKADGVFGAKTYQALLAFQRANRLTADGVAGTKTLNLLSSTSAVSASATTAPNATAAPASSASSSSTTSAPKASEVRYANWYTEIKARCKLYPYATVYDYATGTSWQIHMFSLGAHADSEPLTAADTAKLEAALGGQTWTPKAVWVIFGDGRVYMASIHSYPHAPQHRTDNNFDGHLCVHFPRTAAQVAAIGPYATRHQATIDAGWKVTQAMANAK